jgi:hypothetical protein
VSDPIWTTFANLTKITEEADSLLATYSRTIVGHDFGRFTVDVDDEDTETIEDEGNWSCLYHVTNYRVYERTHRLASRGKLALAISFYRYEDDAGNAWPGAKRAKLYVGFAPVAKAWDTYSLFVNGAGDAPSAAYLGDGLWGNHGKDGSLASWFFCLALSSINSRTDLDELALTPASRLMNGASAKDAFQGIEAILAGPDHR